MRYRRAADLARSSDGVRRCREGACATARRGRAGRTRWRRGISGAKARESKKIDTARSSDDHRDHPERRRHRRRRCGCSGAAAARDVLVLEGEFRRRGLHGRIEQNGGAATTTPGGDAGWCRGVVCRRAWRWRMQFDGGRRVCRRRAVSCRIVGPAGQTSTGPCVRCSRWRCPGHAARMVRRRSCSGRAAVVQRSCGGRSR